jgi:hypothetical protein
MACEMVTVIRPKNVTVTAHEAMRGRGGVRCQVLSDGVLHRGPAVLISPVPLDPGRAGDATLLRPSRLP